MALIDHPFLGALDIDSPLHQVIPGFNIGARNVIWRGPANNRTAESVPGTTARPNPFLPIGVNKCIGAWYDPVNQNIYNFNYNSNGVHGIYIYNTLLKVWQTLIQNGLTTDGDVLGFTASGRITSIALIYGDNNSGDLLVYVDSLRRPTKLNVQRYLAGGYPLIKRSYLNLIKAPPRMPPRVTYENDQNCTINNMRNALFQFRYRWVYDDNDKSVYSTCSIVALPNTPFSQTVDSDPTKNCRESVYLSTGDADVKKIELWVKQVTDSGSSLWLLVSSLDKSQLSISDNSIYRYLFYNDGNYTQGDQNEINLLFDYIPRGTNSMVLLNGNVIMFGGITEGYDSVDINATITTNNTYQPPVTTVNGVLFFASQSGVDSYGQSTILNIYLTGTGINDGSGNPTTIPVVATTNSFVVDCADNAGISKKFQYNNAGSSTSITTILNGLRTAALAQGFTLVSQTQNVLTLSYAAGFRLYYAQLFNTVGSAGANEATLAYGHKDVYQFAIEYFDADGRTNGARIPMGSSIQTLEDLTGASIPEILVSIFSPPPQWAYYYHIVRSLNLTYNKRLFWVSNSTFQQVDQGTGIKYAYINIGNMADYNASIEASTPIVSYDFSAGDRIQFLQNIPFGGGPINLSLINDYEILAVVNDPINNGLTQTGRFIKIQYPTADINANFDFGGNGFQNYKILLYNYVKHASEQSNVVFYEIGKTFAIGNPGTVNAYHIGSDQTQTPTLSQPAIISSTEGDMYWRQRIVPAGNSYYFTTSSYLQPDPYERFIINVSPTVTTPNYTIQGAGPISQPIGPGAGIPIIGPFPIYGSAGPNVYNTGGIALGIRIRGEITVTPTNPGDHNGTFGALIKIIDSTNAVRIVNILADQTGLEPSTNYTYPYDISFSLNPTEKMWILTHCINEMMIQPGQIRIDVLNNVTIPIIEYTYSDKYNIVTNSNGRSTIFDPNAGEFYYNTLVRWGQQYQLGTNLNNSNRFFPQDFDEFDKQWGDIMRLIARNREVDVFQKRKCGHFAVFGRFVQNNQGQRELLTTDQIITPNNIQYYSGDYGVGNQSRAIAISGFQRWFADPVKGVLVRLSLNGCEPISTLFRVQTWAGQTLPNYLNTYDYPYGGNSDILAVYNITQDRTQEILFSLQEGINGPETAPIVAAQTIAYEEVGNKFTAFHDYAPDEIICAENILFSFKGGVMYSHDNTNTVANFYGVQQTPQIISIFNDALIQKKSWISIFQTANRQWNCPLIYTNTFSYGVVPQMSQLVDANFSLLESRWESSFYRDINSPKGWINGDFLKGSYLVCQMEVTSPEKFAYLANVGVKYIPSPLTQS